MDKIKFLGENCCSMNCEKSLIVKHASFLLRNFLPRANERFFGRGLYLKRKPYIGKKEAPEMTFEISSLSEAIISLEMSL